MGQDSKIEWTHHTFNPWIGCSRVSPGCVHCYAEEMMDRRYGRVKWGPSGTRARTSEAYWKQPIRWDREAKAAGERRRVFCGSLADVFEDRPELEEWRDNLFTLIDHTPNLDWLLLTKRPENAAHMVPWADDGLGAHLWPNVWLGVSVEDQARADERIGLLLEISAAVRFLSVEPLLGPVDLNAAIPARPGDAYEPLFDGGIHWCIVGGESGWGARPCDIAWIRSIVEECRSAEIPCFVKQLGANVEACDIIDAADYFPGKVRLAHGINRHNARVFLRDPKGGNPFEWPSELRVRQFPEVVHA